MAFRVPTADVSVVDLTARLSKTASYADICYEVKHASETYMKDIIGYTRDQVVSTDLIGNPCPCIFDETAGISLDQDFVKLIAWYDNEWGYSNMVVRMLEHMHTVDEADAFVAQGEGEERDKKKHPARGGGGGRFLASVPLSSSSPRGMIAPVGKVDREEDIYAFGHRYRQFQYFRRAV